MGSETEYGISVPAAPSMNAMQASSLVVNSYAQRASAASRARWDFEEENPLRDARGFEAAAPPLVDPSAPANEDDLGLANLILTNGARFYVDHAHPEYSTPEVTSPRDVVLWDKAGERIIAEAARRALSVPGTSPVNIYKNNTDNKGVSYGCHENYLMSRSTSFADVIRHLTPFFVSRQVVCGAGRVGIGADGKYRRLPAQPAGRFLRGRGGPRDHAEAPDHQHPRRAARRSGEVPPAARHHRRRQHERDLDLPQGRHHLAGDLDDRGRLAGRPTCRSKRRSPRCARSATTRSLSKLVTLRDGRKMTAVQLQMEYLDQARKFVEDRWGSDADEQTRDVLDPLGIARWCGSRPSR